MNLPKHITGRYLSIKDRLYNFFATITGLTIFNWEIAKQFFIPPYEIEEVKKHMNELGVKTFPIVSVTGFVIGLVIVMQSEPVFVRFGASDYLPGATAISIVRELAPVITALIFAGRVSSGIGAELGSMRVTEQIDAMEVNAINPFKYLVISRVVATTMILPILTIYVIFLSIIGGYIALALSQGMNFEYYKNAVVSSVRFSDLIPSIAKTFVFGYVVGLVGSYKGYIADGGTEGVGKASTTSVVLASLIILLFNTVLVKVSLLLWPL
jgi:phospholipid/cholesterol/gamma-HCH transport system permease protein